MKAFVTGGTGFVGPYLCAHLDACGDDIVLGDEADGFEITNRETVADAIASARPDVVYHLAARSDVAASWRDPDGYLQVNVHGTLHVLDAAREAGVARVLVIGSSEEYGRVDAAAIPVSEDAPLHPVSPYGATKVAASFLALQAWLGAGLETIRARPFGHTGPGQRPDFAVPGFARRIAEAERDGRSTITAGALDPVRDLTDVRDVVRAYRLLIEHGTPGEVYNVCRGEGVSIGTVVQHLLASARMPMRVETDPALLRPADVPVLIGDHSKLHAATGWSPEIALDDTLAAVLDDARRAVQGS